MKTEEKEWIEELLEVVDPDYVKMNNNDLEPVIDESKEWLLSGCQ